MCQYCAVDDSCGHDGKGSVACSCSLAGPKTCPDCGHDCLPWYVNVEIPGQPELSTMLMESEPRLTFPAPRDAVMKFVSGSGPSGPETARWMSSRLTERVYRDPGEVIAAVFPPVEWNAVNATEFLHRVPVHTLPTGTNLVIRDDQRAVLVDAKGTAYDSFRPGTVTLTRETAPRAAAVSRPPAAGVAGSGLDVDPVFCVAQDLPLHVATASPTRTGAVARVSIDLTVRIDDARRFVSILRGPVASLDRPGIVRILDTQSVETIRKSVQAHELSELRASTAAVEQALRAGLEEAGVMVLSCTVAPVEEASPADLASQRLQAIASMPNVPPEVVAKINARLAAGGQAVGSHPGAGPSSSTASPAPMVLCPQCRAPNPQTGKFCGNCGSPLKVRRICSACNQEVAAGVKFCGNCGARLA